MSSHTVVYALYAAALAGAATVAGIVLYIVGSFALMRAHTEPRTFGAALRSALREAFWVIVTQPLIPFYYLGGERLGGSGDGDPVVFVHGYFQNRANFLFLARALKASNVGKLYGFNYPWAARLEGNAQRLARFVERVVKETGRPHVSLVAHSMGGLVCLEYMHTPEGAARVRKCVTIATPHAGVMWRGPVIGPSGAQMRLDGEYLSDRKGRQITVPTLSIYSTHDNVVHPPQTSALTARGGRDHPIGGLGHLSILFDAAVSREVVLFLREEAAAEPTVRAS